MSTRNRGQFVKGVSGNPSGLHKGDAPSGISREQEKREYQRTYYAAHREEIKAKKRAYRSLIRDELNARERERHARNRDKFGPRVRGGPTKAPSPGRDSGRFIKGVSGNPSGLRKDGVAPVCLAVKRSLGQRNTGQYNSGRFVKGVSGNPSGLSKDGVAPVHIAKVVATPVVAVPEPHNNNPDLRKYVDPDPQGTMNKLVNLTKKAKKQ